MRVIVEREILSSAGQIAQPILPAVAVRMVFVVREPRRIAFMASERAKVSSPLKSERGDEVVFVV